MAERLNNPLNPVGWVDNRFPDPHIKIFINPDTGKETKRAAGNESENNPATETTAAGEETEPTGSDIEETVPDETKTPDLDDITQTNPDGGIELPDVTL